MVKTCRGAFVFVVLAAAVARFSGGQERVQQAQRAGEAAQLAARPTVDCVADASNLVQGQTAVIRAKGASPEGRALRYSFTASAGKIVAKGARAELQTLGVDAGTLLVICTVTDDEGRVGSARVSISVRPWRRGVDVPPAPGVPGLPRQPKPDEPQVEEKKAARPGAGTVTPPAQRPSFPPPLVNENTGKHSPGQSPSPASSTPPASAAKPPAPAAKPPGPVRTPAQAQGSAAHEYSQAEAVAKWKSQLKVGKIEYQVPGQMLMQHASTTTVVIHGFGDVATTTLPGATGTGTLKQSERMKVELLAADSPDDFTIVPQGGELVRFVPIDGATTWMWSVTPNSPGAKKRLAVRASVIYPGGDDKTEQQLPDYTAVVEVDVPSYWQMITESYRKDPLKWFSYVIPGGAGFTFLVGAGAWWLKRKKEKK